MGFLATGSRSSLPLDCLRIWFSFQPPRLRLFSPLFLQKIGAPVLILQLPPLPLWLVLIDCMGCSLFIAINIYCWSWLIWTASMLFKIINCCTSFWLAECAALKCAIDCPNCMLSYLVACYVTLPLCLKLTAVTKTTRLILFFSCMHVRNSNHTR